MISLWPALISFPHVFPEELENIFSLLLCLCTSITDSISIALGILLLLLSFLNQKEHNTFFPHKFHDSRLHGKKKKNYVYFAEVSSPYPLKTW